MRNDKLQTKLILDTIYNLPYFEMADLLPVLKYPKSYLKIILSRYSKKEKIIRLKKSTYVSAEYINSLEKKNLLSDYTEFIANILYKSSYLSLEYVLYENSILTESPRHFTSISLAKTANFKNILGTFFYHKIKNELFTGFNITKEGDFFISKATKSKALFDFLYLRKNLLSDKKSADELRLNLDNMTNSDWKELEKYIKQEGSKKMKELLKNLK